MTEKRRNHRRHRVRECQLTLKKGGIASFLSVKSSTEFPVSDVSAEGLCFVANETFEKGDKVKVNLDLPAFVKPLKMESEVVWCTKMDGYDNYFKVGLQFTKLSKEDKTKLERLDHDTMLHHVRRQKTDD